MTVGSSMLATIHTAPPQWTQVLSVIMSLWPVQDAATADWMTALYRARLVDGASTIDAVAAAQRELLTARRARGESVHPYYWAAFVSAGDWR